jgi:hypothetical protein
MMFVFLHDGDTATKFNGIFKTNDEILIQKVPDWDHPEDNLALSFVYGRDPKCANKNSAARKGARKWYRALVPCPQYMLFCARYDLHLLV